VLENGRVMSAIDTPERQLRWHQVAFEKRGLVCHDAIDLNQDTDI